MVDSDTIGLIVDLAGLTLAALPWAVAMWAGRRSVIHELQPVDGSDDHMRYRIRILRRRPLAVRGDVIVHLTRPMQAAASVSEDGLRLESELGWDHLTIGSGSVLQPHRAYGVVLQVAPETSLSRSTEQNGVTLVKWSDWTTTMRNVVWISGAVVGVLVVAAGLAYFGRLPFMVEPDSGLSCMGFLVAAVAGIPGWFASRGVERAGAWFD